MQTSPKAIEFIKMSEGFSAKAYVCPAGVWTIGYGTTQWMGRNVLPGDYMTEGEASKLLSERLKIFEYGINHLVKVPLTQGQFDALVSFSYNLGLGALEESTLLKLLNKGDYSGALNEFPRWVHEAGGEVLPGLVTRRKREQQIWLGKL